MLDQVASLDTVNEEDFYTVTLTAGVTYYIEVECGGYSNSTYVRNLPGFGFLTLDDAFLNLYDPAAGNALIAFDDDGGQYPDSRIVFTPTVSGDYVIGATAFRDDQLGTYRVKVFEDDFRGNASGGSTAGPAAGALGHLANGGGATGTINYVGDGGTSNGDVDVFSVAMAGGLRYRFEILGAETGNGTLVRPALVVLDENDTPAARAFSDPAGSNLVKFFTPTYSGPWFIAVEDWNLEQGGTYEVTMSFGMGNAVAENIFGSSRNDGIAVLGGNDTVYGFDGNDTILGGLGDDLILGYADNDELAGDLGVDSLHGGTGDDLLRGGRNRDVMEGDQGADTFIFDAGDSRVGQHDTIRTYARSFAPAFEIGQDLIDLSAIDGDETQVGHQALVLDGTQGLGHVWLETRNDQTFVLAETDGTGKADFVLVIRDGLMDHSAYGAGDFVL